MITPQIFLDVFFFEYDSRFVLCGNYKNALVTLQGLRAPLVASRLR